MRTPRPMGTTELGRYFNHLPHKKQEEEPNLLIDHIIKHYINTNYRYCNTPMTITQFCNYTNIPEHQVLNHLLSKGQDMGKHLLSDKTVGDNYQALIGMILSNSLTDRQSALIHQSILMEAQGDTYKPFISSEVTKALKVSQESNTQITNLIKAILPQGFGTGLQTGIGETQGSLGLGTESATGADRPLTVKTALELLQQSDNYLPLSEDPKQMALIAQEHNLSEMPEVNAIRQHGVDTSKEGLDFSKLATLSEGIIDDLEDSHIDRRANELDIDIENDPL